MLCTRSEGAGEDLTWKWAPQYAWIECNVGVRTVVCAVINRYCAVGNATGIQRSTRSKLLLDMSTGQERGDAGDRFKEIWPPQSKIPPVSNREDPVRKILGSVVVHRTQKFRNRKLSLSRSPLSVAAWEIIVVQKTHRRRRLPMSR